MGTAANNFPEQLARAVRELMNHNGISVKALSEATHIPRTTLARKLTGEPLTSSQMQAIANHFGITITQLTSIAETDTAA
jgi:transcriptional regulator with XRE-family HTH domain